MKINMDNKLFKRMAKMFDCVLVAFYWMICSLPIVTFGASSSAAMSLLLEVNRTSNSITHGFFTAFKKNFKQATLMWCILLAAGALLAVEINLCTGESFRGEVGTFIKYMLVVLAFSFCVCVSMIFAIEAKFEVTVAQGFYNVLVLSVKNPGWTLLMVLQTAIIALGFYLLLAFGFVIAAVGLYAQSRIFKKMAKEYFQNETENSEDITEYQ